MQSRAICSKKGNKITTNKQADVILSISMSKHPNKNSVIVKFDKNIRSNYMLHRRSTLYALSCYISLKLIKTLHSTELENTFSSAQGTLTNIDYLLGHKISLSKFKSFQVMQSIFSDYRGIK